LRGYDIHAEHVPVCGPPPQQDYAEVPVLDGDVLLGCHLWFLPKYGVAEPGYLLENGDLGRSSRPWVGGIGV
jgi:hypothetical protein